MTEEGTEDDFSDGETAAGQSSAGENEVVDVPAAQAEESSEGSTEDEQAKAQAYLKENFIDGSNKIITSGGTGVTKVRMVLLTMLPLRSRPADMLSEV